MVFPQGQLMNVDSCIVTSMMKELGINDYDPKIINQLLEFNYKYVTGILDDSKNFAKYTKNKDVDVADVKLAISMVNDGLCYKSPTRHALIAASREFNKKPLPKIISSKNLRIPHNTHLAHANYILRNDLEDSTPKISSKVMAADILEVSNLLKQE